MSTQKSTRKKFASLLATATAALVVASGMALAPSAAFAADAPVLTVTPATGLTDGDLVTVTGSGYNPNQAIYVTTCTDAELVEVDFAFINNGCADGAKLVWQQGANRGLEFAEDGSFSTTINLKQREGTTALYTIANHSAMSDRTQDAKASLAFVNDAEEPEVPEQPEAPATKLSAKVTNATKDKLVVEAALTNIPATSGGVYAALAERGNDSLDEDDMGLAAYITKKQIVDGAATGVIAVDGDDLSRLDRKKQYQVIVWEHQSFPTAENTYARANVEITSAQWDAVFKKDETKPTPKPEVKIPFTDVKKGQKFYNEIAWMYTANVTTGVKQADGTVKYMPKANVTREAMAAFLYRQYGDKNYQAPKNSKFTDVKFGDKFYKEIAWMDSKGYSTGVKQADGSVKYMPKANVTREAMAAFIYRIEQGAGTGKSVVFNDVKPGHKFFKEIDWMSGTGITTGIKQSNGTYNYAPKANVTREAMAAFLSRADKL